MPTTEIKTYWNRTRKQPLITEYVAQFVPNKGFTENDYVNAYIAANKIYYDFYSNGHANLFDDFLRESDDPWINELVEHFTIIKNELDFKITEKSSDEIQDYFTVNHTNNIYPNLEAFMTNIFAILEKHRSDITAENTPKYAIYQTEHAKQIRHIYKNGWKKITFGTTKERDHHIMDMVLYRNHAECDTPPDRDFLIRR